MNLPRPFAAFLVLLCAASPPAVEADHFMVVSANRLASEAGVEILRAGGNAVDAAVAVGYALAVVDPCCGNIGGGGFMTLRLADGRTTFLDFRETAPAAAGATMYLGADGKPVPGSSLYGWKAAGVPGTVAGLDAALSRYGSQPLKQVMAPAIRLARDGFVLTRADADILAGGVKHLALDPAAKKVFFRPDGGPLAAGDRLVQTDLAAMLQAIANQGDLAFYGGPVPAAIEAASQAGGGVLTAADFAAYRVRETKPVTCLYRSLKIVSAPPPSSGGTTLCEILGVLQGYDLHALGFHGAAGVHLMAEAMRHAFLDRNTYLGDPDFVDNPTDWLLSEAHLSAIRAAIGARATPSASLAIGAAPHERPETTSFAVMDAAGNAVSVTYTLNGGFGAGVMAPGTGFLLNDEMDDFSIAPNTPNLFGLVQGVRNAIAPGKRPLSSMSPTIVLRDDKPAYVLGSPGGSRIITIVAEVLLNLVDHGMAPQESVDAPRLHMQYLPDKLFAEPLALSPDTAALLREEGYDVVEQTPWGAAELIAVMPASGDAAPASSGNDATPEHGSSARLLGASDPRRPAGAAVGD